VEERAGVPHDDIQSAISFMLAAYAAGPVIASPFIGWIAGNFPCQKAKSYRRSNEHKSIEFTSWDDFTSWRNFSLLFWT
jgi:hypothetical protein